jgi:DNA-binding GntR family transcriptional regulator
MKLWLGEQAGSAVLGPVALQVRRIIEGRIVTNQLHPGERVSENELASLLGVSRQPVREALIRLAEAGLVRILPQRGTVVSRISVPGAESARFVREAVERAVVREAALRADASAIARMRALIVMQKAAAKVGDHATFLSRDDELHCTFAAAIEHEGVWRMLHNAKLQMDRVRYLSLPDATPTVRLIRQHEALVDAIEAKNPDQAEAIIRQHLSELLRSLPQLVSRLPDYFETAAESTSHPAEVV